MPKSPQERQKSYRERVTERGIVTISHRVPVSVRNALTALAEAEGVGVAELLTALIGRAETALLTRTDAEGVNQRERYWTARDQLSR